MVTFYEAFYTHTLIQRANKHMNHRPFLVVAQWFLFMNR